ncbi:hypothetical protein V8E55_012143 [Tylopilus felleus]
MSSKEISEVHHPAPGADVPKISEGLQTEEEFPASAEPSKDKTAGTAVPTSSHAQPDYDSDSEGKRSPQPESAPCTCRCGGCCCHGSSTELQHCVRCHTNYTFNHSQACMVPHVFYSFDRYYGEDLCKDAYVRSVCCGSEVFGGEPIKGDWNQPFPCFIGWHATDVDVVKEQYNGLNVLRCELGPEGKCLREQMKHHAHYENLYSDDVKYNKEDNEDRGRYLKRKREDMREGWPGFEGVFGHVDEKGKIGARDLKNIKWRKHP